MISTKKYPPVLLLAAWTLLGLLSCINSFAQSLTVTGTVTNKKTTAPIPGVSVVIKNTSRHAITDATGKFTLEAAAGNVLQVSMIGFVKQEVTLGKSGNITIELAENVSQLEDVVVIGYGKTKRKDVTGAISSVSGDEIRKTQPVTIDQAMQGKVPGLVVQQVSGQPGGAVSVQIRGLSSFGGSAPMYVIDGVIIGGTASLGAGTNPLAGINPSEIESIDVLKDASATAIYGSQATNGVIVITTRRGLVAPPAISYDMYAGVQQIPKRLPLMNLREYATFINERNNALGWGFDTREDFVNPKYLGEGTDWQKELFRNAPMSNHSLTINGGDVRTQYLLSGAYFKQEGIALGSDFERVSVRLNLDNKTTNWLKIGTSLQLANIKESVNTTGNNVISSALSQTPDIAVRNVDGSWGGNYNPDGWVNNNVVNPFAYALINKDDVLRYQLFGSLYADIAFYKDLSLRNEITLSYSTAREDRFNPSYTFGIVKNTNNSGSFIYNQNLFKTIRNYFTYTHVFDKKYSVNAVAGHEAQQSTNEGASAARSNFPSNNVQVISSGDPTTATNSGTKGQNAQESYFGRVNVGLFDKYLLTGNVRADGSSKFAPDNRWVTTWSGAFAWKLNNEEFLKQVRQLNELKLRIGYGLTNNQNIRDYAYTSTLMTVATGLTGIAQLTVNVGNPLVQWEKTKYTNIGLDGTLFNWKINFALDFYNRRTDGLVMQIPLPLYSGTAIGWAPGSLDAPYVNIGTVNNKGFDFRISSTNIQRRHFSWKTDVTVSRNINEVIKLNTDGASLNGQVTKTVVGRSIGEFYGYVIDGGVFATRKDFETHALPVKNGEPLPVGAAGGSIWYGDLKFKDFNGDGIINEKDQTFLGSPIPKYQIGLNNTFTYKNFDLNIFFNANIGNKVFNRLRINGDYPGTSYGYMRSLMNYAQLGLIDTAGSATDINNVYVKNPGTRTVGLRNDNTNDNNRNSDKFVENGDFLRCKNISLGYALPDKLLSILHIHYLRLYVNVSNAFIITNYSGMDPEIGSWDPLNAGVDGGYYPQPRVYTIGANIKLTK
ncbi:TonB-linked outer membrane protein, SusC/RagA family [Chitinophaga jiangningensis]|uniref:TonB-linked outer membrane protein, SusC/RagA family n=1 Tax=Chitinophaga jiangningensis TaxID=1419482 RepID=A0A1M7J9C7_9BACT|nr:TonB-dependent receptor [Chitinophaga jiangningensis]SHM49473.1 TonB-linked outer membrane protein, SusC/RagA family [Chitinophaga jiangningensis]